jgi:hypothetical protein
MRNIFSLPTIVLLLLVGTAVAEEPASTILYDFEAKDALAAWENLVLEQSKEQEPAVKLEQVAEYATSGKQSLKLTFSGGNWPTVTTTKVDDAWLRYQTFHADVFAARPCLVGFTVFQEKSERGEGWEPLISRWTKTALLQKGANHITAALPQPNDYAIHAKWGKVVRFEIFMYAPHAGESIYIDKISLSSEKLPPSVETTFTVAGTDIRLTGKSSADAVIALGKQFKDKWKPSQSQSVAQFEEQMRAKFAELKKTHPRAVLAILRDGEKGFDPTDPNRVYAGWKDAYFNSHGPDGNYLDRARNGGKSTTYEVFMRHRSPVMRVDLSSIPAGASILAARLVVVRSTPAPSDRDPEKEPTMWAVEPCNRPWEEYEVNAFEFAKGKFWKAVGGMEWQQDADFEPVFLAHGPSQGKDSSWDFIHAVRYWTDGKHENQGFMLHGDSHDYMKIHSREAEKIEDRPAVIVIYEPK